MLERSSSSIIVFTKLLYSIFCTQIGIWWCFMDRMKGPAPLNGFKQWNNVFNNAERFRVTLCSAMVFHIASNNLIVSCLHKIMHNTYVCVSIVCALKKLFPWSSPQELETEKKIPSTSHNKSPVERLVRLVQMTSKTI